jgi:hypothetical protein
MLRSLATRDTLLPFELDEGDTLELTLRDGSMRRLERLSAHASIYETNLARTQPLQGRFGGVTVARMEAKIRLEGYPITLVRWVGNQQSFYEPWKLFGLHLWFDAARALFDHFNENHGPCAPRRAARFAVQEENRRIGPGLLHPWCPLPAGGLRIEDCYQGADCWLGPYCGADAPAGLDLNHPAGTSIWRRSPSSDTSFPTPSTGATTTTAGAAGIPGPTVPPGASPRTTSSACCRALTVA